MIPQRWLLTCHTNRHVSATPAINGACTSQTLEDVSIYLFWTVRAGITHPASSSVCDYTSEQQNARWLISVFESPDLKRWTNVRTKTCFRVRWRTPVFDRFTGSSLNAESTGCLISNMHTHRYECLYFVWVIFYYLKNKPHQKTCKTRVAEEYITADYMRGALNHCCQQVSVMKWYSSCTDVAQSCLSANLPAVLRIYCQLAPQQAGG